MEKNKKFSSFFKSNPNKAVNIIDFLKSRVDKLEKRVKVLEEEHKRMKK